MNEQATSKQLGCSCSFETRALIQEIQPFKRHTGHLDSGKMDFSGADVPYGWNVRNHCFSRQEVMYGPTVTAQKIGEG